MDLLLTKLLCGMREARRACQTLLRFTSSTALEMLPHCSKEPICFANSLGSNSCWCNIERIFSAVRLPAVESECKGETVRTLLRNSAVGKAFSWIDVDHDTVGNGMHCSSEKTSSANGGGEMEHGRTIEGGEGTVQKLRSQKSRTEVKKQVN